MREIAMLGGFLLAAAVLFCLISRLGLFLKKLEDSPASQKKQDCLRVAISNPCTISSIAEAMEKIKGKHPGAAYTLSMGREQEVLQSFDQGMADVAVVSAEAEERDGRQFQKATIGLRPVHLGDSGLLLQPICMGYQNQKVLFQENGRPIAVEFVQQLCKQK